MTKHFFKLNFSTFCSVMASTVARGNGNDWRAYRDVLVTPPLSVVVCTVKSFLKESLIDHVMHHIINLLNCFKYT